jgi:hypothetical protein
MLDRLLALVFRSLMVSVTTPQVYLGQAVKFFTIFLIVAGLVGPIVIAVPDIKNFLFCQVDWLRGSSAEDRELYKNWLDLVILVCQIAIAIALGGIAFTDRMAKIVRDRIDNMQKLQAAELNAKDREIRAALLTQYRHVLRLAHNTTLFELPGKLFQICRLSWRSYKTLTSDISTFWGLFLRLRLMTAFPGGSYGFFAFLLFTAMTTATASKTYLDYAPSCH